MEVTIPAAVAAAAREFGDAEALAEPDGPKLTYRELDERVSEVARALIADGIAPGDRVAVWCPNTAAWVLAALGALTAGATLVPVSTRFTGPEALDVISRSGARALFVADDFLGTDRLATLRAAAAAADAGGSLARLALAVASQSVTGPDLPNGRWRLPRPQPRLARRRSARMMSATSCSPRAPPGAARA